MACSEKKQRGVENSWGGGKTLWYHTPRHKTNTCRKKFFQQLKEGVFGKGSFRNLCAELCFVFFCVLRWFSPANLTDISFRNCPSNAGIFWNPLAKNPKTQLLILGELIFWRAGTTPILKKKKRSENLGRNFGVQSIPRVAPRVAPRIGFSHTLGRESHSESCSENAPEFRELLREWPCHSESVFSKLGWFPGFWHFPRIHAGPVFALARIQENSFEESFSAY